MNEDTIYKATIDNPHHVSCGSVVVDDKDSTIRIMFVYRDKERRYYYLPKGTLEENETPQQCAKRETLEESGVSVDIIGYIGHQSYSYNEGFDVEKTVLFYAVRPNDEELREIDGEYDGVEWVDYPEALNKITHKDDGIMIERAVNLIKAKN